MEGEGEGRAGSDAVGDSVSIVVDPVNTALSAGVADAPSSDGFGTPSLNVSLTTNQNVGGGTGPSEDLDVEINYDAFDNQQGDSFSPYGGEWAQRLMVMAYPACSATDTALNPAPDECMEGVPVPAVNDTVDGKVTFTAPPPLLKGETAPAAPTEAQLASCYQVVDEDEQAEAGPDGDPWTAPTTIDTSAEPASTDGLEADLGDGEFDDTDEADELAVDERPDEDTRDVSTGVPVVVVSDASYCRGMRFVISAGAGSYARASAGGAGAGGGSATALNPSSSWQVGEGSGEFSWSYPFALPPGIGDEAPELALSYSSAAVDGMSSPEAGQASAAGLGWNLDPGHISRDYAACAQDGNPSRGDMCWRTTSDGKLINDLTVVLGGRATKLIRVANTNEWRLQDDPGWRIDYNGDVTADTGMAGNETESFVITSPDGTRYFFGSQDGASDSVWTVPVFGNQAGEPCHRPAETKYKNRYCMQGWQWNLDKVIDADGNQVTYYYNSEKNYYQRASSLKDANRTGYDRAGRLNKVEYGYVREIGHQGPRVTVQATSLQRCNPALANPSVTCTETAVGIRKAANKWPDVPSDLICGPQSACRTVSPSFFSIYRYANIAVRRSTAAGTKLLDFYAFEHKMPDPDQTPGSDEPDLWLDKIYHIPGDGPTTATVPPVDFAGVAKQNRVKPGNALPLKKMRVASVRNEMGGRIQVEYGHDTGPNTDRTCDAAYVTDRRRWASNRECFAVKYAPPGSAKKPEWVWFHKYVVKAITLTDDALGLSKGNFPSGGTSLATNRRYEFDYLGQPGWRFDNGSVNTPIDKRSWTDWRGYETTLIKTMKMSDPVTVSGVKSIRRVTRYRGLSRSRANKNGNNRTTYVSTVEHKDNASKLEDLNALQGRVAEETVLDGDSKWLSRTYHGYQVVKTAKDYLDREASFVGENLTRTHTRVTRDNGLFWDRSHTIARDLDTGGANGRGLLLGVVKTSKDRGAATNSGNNNDPDVCTITSWASNSSKWLRVPIAETIRDNSCLDSAPMLARTETSYENSQVRDGASLNTGRPSRVATWTTGSGAPLVTEAHYDIYGRIDWTEDANNNRTTITYNAYESSVERNDLVTKIDTAAPIGHTTTSLDARGLPVSVKDVENNATTTTTYDGYGRVLSTSSPLQRAAGRTSVDYHYNVNATSGAGPSTVRTTTHAASTDSNTPADVVTWDYFDGWGRSIESQARHPNNTDKRIVTATSYNELGLPAVVIPGVANLGAAGSRFLNPRPDQAPRSVQTSYDALGRPTATKQYAGATLKTTTVLKQQGDRLTTLPPAGAGLTVESYDGWGRTKSVQQYEQRSLNGDPTPAHSASYEYTGTGLLTKISSKIAGVTENWTYGYDLAGRRKSANDPDTGLTTYTYDANGNQLEVTNLVDGTIKTDYDAMDRPFRRTAVGGPNPGVLVDWTYDTASGGFGKLASVTSHTTQLGDFKTTITGYDPDGNVTGTQRSYPANMSTSTPTGTATYTETFGYNGSGAPTSASYGAIGNLPATTMAYSYLPNTGQISSITAATQQAGNTVSTTLAGYRYDALGRTIKIKSVAASNPDSLTLRNYTWDNASGRLESIDSTRLGKLSYAYDDLGNPVTITQNVGSAERSAAWCYTYDALNRLKTARTGNAATQTTPACTTAAPASALDLYRVPQNYTYTYADDRLTSVR